MNYYIFLGGTIIGFTLGLVTMYVIAAFRFKKYAEQFKDLMNKQNEAQRELMATLLQQHYDQGAKDASRNIQAAIDTFLKENKKKDNIISIMIATGNMLGENDSQLIIAGISWTQRQILLCEDFSAVKPIGTATPYFKGGNLWADLRLTLADDWSRWENYTPAAGGKVVESHEDGTGVKIVDKFELNTIALCTGPNVDKAIRPIKEQILNQ